MYPEITFENALNLTPGLYLLRPTSYDDWDKGGFGDRVLTRLYWGNVDKSGSTAKIRSTAKRRFT